MMTHTRVIVEATAYRKIRRYRRKQIPFLIFPACSKKARRKFVKMLKEDFSIIISKV